MNRCNVQRLSKYVTLLAKIWFRDTPKLWPNRSDASSRWAVTGDTWEWHHGLRHQQQWKPNRYIIFIVQY